MTGLEKMIAFASGKLPKPPIAKLIGFSFQDVADGYTRMSMDVTEKLYNPMGTLHGGVLCDLGDAAMGCAAATKLAEDESYTTLELKINFFKPVRSGHLVAQAKVTRTTKSIIFVECEVTDENESIVAKLSSSCIVLRGDAASGR